MKLYTFPIAPNPTRVNIYLGKKGIEIEKVLVNLREGEQKSEAHLARHPFGKLPVLELDDRECITESPAIIEYLEELHPDPPMIGTTPIERARVRALDRVADLGVLIAFAKTVHSTNSPLGLPANPVIAEASMEPAAAALAFLDRRLERNEFLGGERPCIADCTLRAGYGFAEFFKIDVPKGFSNVDRWREAMDARPSVQNL